MNVMISNVQISGLRYLQMFSNLNFKLPKKLLMALFFKSDAIKTQRFPLPSSKKSVYRIFLFKMFQIRHPPRPGDNSYLLYSRHHFHT